MLRKSIDNMENLNLKENQYVFSKETDLFFKSEKPLYFSSSKVKENITQFTIFNKLNPVRKLQINNKQIFIEGRLF